MSKILIVDDNETNRKLVVAMLGFEGHETREAVDGAEALVTARAMCPDLVISDILMPTMDGYEFARRLRLEPNLRDTPIIFHTAYYHEAKARHLAQACRVARVLVKPCPSGEFLEAVTHALAPAAAAQAAPMEEGFDREHLRVVTNMAAQQADALRSANARLEALTELNMQLASERDPHVLLEKVCQGARSLLGAKYAVLAANGRGTWDSCVFASSGTELDADSMAQLSVTDGVLGKVVTQRQATRLSRAENHVIDCVLPAAFPVAEAILAAPIVSITRSFGWLCLVNKVGEPGFDPDDERILSILGAQAGRIYENGSLYREIKLHAVQLQMEMDSRERATAGLRESEERFRQLTDSIQDVFFIFSGDLSSVLYVSPAYERIWGRPLGALRELPLTWAVAVHPGDVERVKLGMTPEPAAVRGGAELEFRIVRPDGEQRWISVRTYPVTHERTADARIVGVATDITQRKLAEARIGHLSRVHAMLSGINSLIVRVKDRYELFRESCRLAVEHGRFRVAWCGWRDGNSGEVIPVAWAGASPDLAEANRCTLNGPVETESLIPAAMRSQKPIVCNRLDTEQRRVRFVTEMCARGYQGIGAFPLIIDGVSVGCLVLITDEREFFTEAEMRLLTELAGDISFALDHIAKSERINYLAYYDSLTDLANRNLFHERLSQYVSAAARGGRTFALVIAEPERLDAVNDSYGRHTGDELIRQLAGRLTTCAGNPNSIARLSALQFAVLIFDVRDETDVVLKVEELWRSWLGMPYKLDSMEFRVVAKAGIAIFPGDGANAESLTRNAEAALKNSKSGPEKFLFYTVRLSAHAAETLAMENELREALEREEFVLHYQPKVDLESRQLQGVEALIRWRHPQRGLVSPLQFIPLLEETGMIVEVGAWVVRQACLDRSRWLERRLEAPRIAVNVSTVQLQRADFVRTVGNILKLAGTEAGIDIEVTESVIMDDASENIAKLLALRDLGITIAIDDFGTGYSSLGYLTKLPAALLKIDRSFVSAMLDDPGAMTLVSTIISLARSLDLKVIAEGVESEEQAKILRLLRCNQMQGYLITKPLPFDEMTHYLARSRAVSAP